MRYHLFLNFLVKVVKIAQSFCLDLVVRRYMSTSVCIFYWLAVRTCFRIVKNESYLETSFQFCLNQEAPTSRIHFSCGSTNKYLIFASPSTYSIGECQPRPNGSGLNKSDEILLECFNWHCCNILPTPFDLWILLCLLSAVSDATSSLHRTLCEINCRILFMNLWR